MNTLQVNKSYPYDEIERGIKDVHKKNLWTLVGNVLIGVCVPDWIKVR